MPNTALILDKASLPNFLHPLAPFGVQQKEMNASPAVISILVFSAAARVAHPFLDNFGSAIVIGTKFFTGTF
jgi:hypothetical protein